MADIHHLSSVFTTNDFDAVIAWSVFEHFQRPWIATKKIATILKRGGKVFVQTHFAFPVHGYPSDYWKFTREALETIFIDAGLNIVDSEYEFPCQFISERVPSLQHAEAFLNSCVVASKPPPRHRRWNWVMG